MLARIALIALVLSAVPALAFDSTKLGQLGSVALDMEELAAVIQQSTPLKREIDDALGKINNPRVKPALLPPRCRIFSHEIARCFRSTRAQDALPDRSAQVFAADHKIDNDRRKQDQRRHAFEFETLARHVAGQVTDRIATHEKDRQEVEYGGDHLPPSGYRFVNVSHERTPFRRAQRLCHDCAAEPERCRDLN
jgi:hypothetical protein